MMNEGIPYSAWAVIAGESHCMSDLEDLIRNLEDSPRFKTAAMLQCLISLRERLENIPEGAELSQMVEIPLQYVAVITMQLMKRLQ